MFALRDFRYRDLETGAVVDVKHGDPVSERVLRMHRDGGAALLRTKFVERGEASVEAPVVKRKRGRPKKSV
jgi:hypothetical protein